METLETDRIRSEALFGVGVPVLAVILVVIVAVRIGIHITQLAIVDFVQDDTDDLVRGDAEM